MRHKGCKESWVTAGLQRQLQVGRLCNASCKQVAGWRDAGHSRNREWKLPLTPGLSVRRGRVPPAFAAIEVDLHPLLVVPGLVRGLQADGCGDDVERAVPHNEPSILGFRQHDEAAALWPLVAVGLAARVPQGCDAGSGFRNVGEAEGCLKWGNSALVIGAARWQFALGPFAKVSGEDDCLEHEAHIPDEEQ